MVSEERNDFTLEPTIRAMVHFERRNLVEEDAAFFRSDAFDVVLCRNVLMYFTPEATHAVIRRLARCLAVGGLLFVGHAETWRVACPELELCQTHDTFYYRKRGPRRCVGGFPGEVERPVTERSSRDWRDAIARSAGRVTSLVEAHLALHRRWSHRVRPWTPLSLPSSSTKSATPSCASSWHEPSARRKIPVICCCTRCC